MNKLLYILTTCFLIQTNAAGLKCLYKNKEIDIYSSNSTMGINGEVVCQRVNESGKEILEYKNGRKISKRVNDKYNNYSEKYEYDANGNDHLHGEKIEYFINSSKIKIKKNYDMGFESGLQSEFYESGKPKELQLYIKTEKDKRPEQTSAIGYHENGDYQYVRCSKIEKENIDSKLCGFPNPHEIKLTNKEGKVKSTIVFNKGEKTATANAINPSKYGSILKNGFITSPKAVERKTDSQNDGRQKITELYEGGKTKRIFFTDKQGRFLDQDVEYFMSGQVARTTQFQLQKENSIEFLDVMKSECFWENGQKRFEIQKENKHYKLNVYYDNGKLRKSGKYLYEESYYPSEYDLDELIGCSGLTFYSLKPTGLIQTFYENGNKEIESNYVNGKLHGKTTTYDENGKIKTIESFENNILTALQKYQNDKVILNEQYNSDGSRK